MKKIKIITIFFILILILFACTKKEAITLPDPNDLTGIKIEKFEDEEYIMTKEYNGEAIEKIIEKIKSESSFYSKDSINEIPINTDELYRIVFLFKENEDGSRAHIYKKKRKYFIEQPYVGIWKLPEEVYKDLIDLN